MIEYIIRRAIIWTITIAIVFGVTKAISNSTSKALSKGLEKKLLELGKIESKEDLDEDLINELIDINVSRQGGYYLVTFQENIYGIFETSFLARGKKDAIKKLSKKIFGFTFVNKDLLSNEQKDFFLRIWFETFSKKIFENELNEANNSVFFIKNDIQTLKLDIYDLNDKKSSYKYKLESLQLKLEKFISKNKQKKVEKIKNRIKEIKYSIKEIDKNISTKNFDINLLEKEKEELDKILQNKTKIIENPKFKLEKKELSLIGFNKVFKFI